MVILGTMKTAISIPDHLFEEADRLAAARGISRSELYAEAVARYVEAQKGLGVRERLDAIYSRDPNMSALEPEVGALQAGSLRGKKW